MKRVKVLLVKSEPDGVRAWGEVKALDEDGAPTIAHIEATPVWADVFMTIPGRHCFQFRTTEPCKLTLSASVNGIAVGPPEEFDATAATAGHHFQFEVSS